jgi:hypothetical protein
VVFLFALVEAVDEELDGELVESQVGAREYSMLIKAQILS